MREVLFRAWYNDRELLPVDSLFFGNGYPFAYLNRDGISFGQGRCNVILEQYTGMTDKNGVKIFEGDIVRGVEVNGSWCDCVVKFHSGCFWYRQISGEKLSVPCYTARGLLVEIVGNIHETPELLEATN